MLLWMITLLGISATAQFKSIRIDNEPDRSGNQPTNVSVAISRKNPDIIVAASSSDNVYYSADGGKTWSKSTITSRYGVGSDPVVIADFSGNFYYLHRAILEGKSGSGETESGRIVIHKSKDGGKTWDSGEPAGSNTSKLQTRPWMTADRKGNFLLTWTEFDQYGSEDPECKSAVFASKSSNGSKWSKPIKISQYDGDCRDVNDTPRGVVPVATNDGKLFIAWSNAGYIWLDRSYNGGEFWLSNDIAITNQTGGWNFNVPGFNQANGMPIIVSDNSTGMFSGALYLVWADQRNGEDDTDIWFSRSFNYGDNWTSPMRINNDDPGNHQFMPRMCVDSGNGHIYILYYDRRDFDDNQTDVYLAYSIDNGGTFKNLKISESPFLPQPDALFSDYAGITAHQGNVIMVWTRMDEGKTSIWSSAIKMSDLEETKEAPKTGKKKGNR